MNFEAIGRRIESPGIVLLYHRVARISPDRWSLAVTPEHFQEHLEVLRRFRCVRLDQLPTQSFLRRGLTVAITFDDGYADNLHEAKRLLARFDTPATFFITTGLIGENREFWWDELDRIVSVSYPPEGRESAHSRLYSRLQPLSHAVRRQILDEMFAECGEPTSARHTHRILTAEELQRLAADDLVEIGAHTVTHPVLAAQSAEAQCAELHESKSWLENLLDRAITSFSYPFGGRGHYSDTTIQEVRRAGFDRACTTTARPVSRFDNPYEWGRINVTDMDGGEFLKLLAAAC